MMQIQTDRETAVLVLLLAIATVLVVLVFRPADRPFAADAWSLVARSFSWLKLFYTAILVALIGMLAAEVYRIWLDPKSTMGTVTVIKDGAKDDTLTESLALQLVERHSDLRWRFANVERSNYASEQSLTPETGEPISRAETVLSDLNIVVQEIPVTDILARLRTWISPPQAIHGRVSLTGNEFRGHLDLVETEIELADGQTVPGVIRVEGDGELRDVVFELACGLIWVDGARATSGADIARIGREEFCHWTKYWVEQQRLERKLRQTGTLNDNDQTRVGVAIKAVMHAIDVNKVTYAKYWLLRADLSRLLPDEELRKDETRRRIQNDYLTYLTKLRLDPKRDVGLAGSDAEAFRILAEARPAIPFFDGALELDGEGLWQRILEDLDGSREAVRKAGTATGLFRFQAEGLPEFEASPVQGLAIGENLVVTTAYNIIPGALRPKGDTSELIEVPDSYKGRFAFVDIWPDVAADEDVGLPIRRILYVEGPGDRPELALLELEGHNTETHPPLAVNTHDTARLAQDDFVFLVGYPEFDARLPSEFTKLLLGERGGGVKRIMPGRVVGLPLPGNKQTGSILSGDSIVVDASTSGGTGGAPLMDLRSGTLVGLNMAGSWKSLADGKFAYVRPMERLFPGERVETYMKANFGSLAFDGLLSALTEVDRRSVEEIAAPAVGVATEVDSLEAIVRAAAEPIPDADDYASRSGYAADFLSEPVPLPTGPAVLGSAGKLLPYQHFSIRLDSQRRVAAFAAANIDGAQLNRQDRVSAWVLDARVPPNWQVDSDLFRRNELDIGHVVHLRGVQWGSDAAAQTATLDVQHFTNASPQHQDLNRRGWAQLEQGVLSYLEATGQRATVFTGPVLRDDDPIYRDVQVPRSFWKIVVTDIDGELRAAGFLLNQEIDIDDGELRGRAENFDVVNSRASISNLEALTGLDFGKLRELEALEFDVAARK